MAATRTKPSSNGSKRKPPAKRARRSLLASRRGGLAGAETPARAPSRRRRRARADRPRRVPGGRRIPALGGRRARRRRGDGAARSCSARSATRVPVALALAGALVLMRELRPPRGRCGPGAVCLTAAITLALAAGTLGLGPGPHGARVLAGARVRGARRGPRRGRVLGRVPPDLDRRRATSWPCSCSSPACILARARRSRA